MVIYLRVRKIPVVNECLCDPVASSMEPPSDTCGGSVDKVRDKHLIDVVERWG